MSFSLNLSKVDTANVITNEDKLKLQKYTEPEQKPKFSLNLSSVQNACPITKEDLQKAANVEPPSKPHDLETFES